MKEFLLALALSFTSFAAAESFINQTRSTDDQIAQQIRDVLKPGMNAKEYDGVFFEIDNGKVTLQGVVYTVEDREKIFKTVRAIKGVSKVTNQIKLNSDNPIRWGNALSDKRSTRDHATTDADYQLNKKIRDRLNGGWASKASYEGVILRTSNGIVIITGNVDKPEDVQKVTAIVKRIPGVKNVNNQLQINDTGY